MAVPSKDSFGDLERHRLRLEDQIEKLRKSLQHWQTWDAEYEGLKEEIQAFKGDPTVDDMMAIGKEFGGDLVNEKEMRELLGVGKGVVRNAEQVVELISRRQDYVQQNTGTVQKQVDAAEDKLNKVLVVSGPEMNDEQGNPLTDIREELDEEGNIISSSLSTPGQSAPKVMEALRKAGVTDLDDDITGEDKLAEKQKDATGKGASEAHASSSAAAPVVAFTAAPKENLVATQAKGKSPEKSVSFAADTKEPAKPKPSKNPAAALGNFTKGRRVIEVDEYDNEIGSTPIIPDDESPEDAAMRREMLEYGLNEVGAVVAELNLYEGDSDIEDEDEEPYYDKDEEQSDIEEIEVDDENWWAKGSKTTVSDDYRQKMLDLERKLNARMMENVGPAPDNTVLPEDADMNNMLQQAQGAHRLVVRSDTAIPPSQQEVSKPASDAAGKKQPSAGKKGVRFAEELDISPAPSTTVQPAPEPEPKPISQPSKPTISESIIERTAPSSSTSAPASAPASAPDPTTKPKKPSRFKSARAAGDPIPPSQPQLPPQPQAYTPRPMPTGPANRTLAASIVERDTPAAAQVTEPDETDPALLRREVAAEYHRVRNRLIQKQGGFLERGEEEGVEVPDPEGEGEGEDGERRKVSRFKAARLRGAQM